MSFVLLLHLCAKVRYYLITILLICSCKSDTKSYLPNDPSTIKSVSFSTTTGELTFEKQTDSLIYEMTFYQDTNTYLHPRHFTLYKKIEYDLKKAVFSNVVSTHPRVTVELRNINDLSIGHPGDIDNCAVLVQGLAEEEEILRLRDNLSGNKIWISQGDRGTFAMTFFYLKKYKNLLKLGQPKYKDVSSTKVLNSSIEVCQIVDLIRSEGFEKMQELLYLTQGKRL